MEKNKLGFFVTFAAIILLCVGFCVGCKTEVFRVSFMDGETIVAEITVEKGKTVSAPDYGKEGYDVVWLNGDVAYDFKEPVESNLTLNAEFTVKEYTVTVANSDGSVLKKSRFRTAARQISIPFRRYTPRKTDCSPLKGGINPRIALREI